MILFVNLKEAYSYYDDDGNILEEIKCFAFLDTIYNIFIDIGHEQVFHDAAEFIYMYQNHLNNETGYWNDKELERFLCLIPDEYMDEEAKKYLGGFNG